MRTDRKDPSEGSAKVRLIADFRADLFAMARVYLQDCSPGESFPDNELLFRYFDSLRRWPAARPRQVWLADNFECPEEVAAGWEILRAKVANGEDIRPHLSLRHSALTNLDGLLNEWATHHFHVGAKPHPTDSRYVERTNQVLLALITDDDFYAINVRPEHGRWEAADIIESLNRNWPHVIRPYVIRDVKGEHLTENQRRQLRKSNVQTVTEVSDGTAYVSLGGGVVMSGVSFIAVRRAAQALAEVKQLEHAVREQLEKFIVHLQPRGHSDQQEVRAKLIAIQRDGYQILFPDYGVRVNVPFIREELAATA